MRLLKLLVLTLSLTACASIPPGVEPVSGFELERYLGQWYEIARLDHRFERGLDNVTAHYSLNDDGSVRVENRGFSAEENQWRNAVGKARLAGEEDVGKLEVSFFGPFYGPYVIFELDKKDYQHAFVTSGGNALWLLARTPTISEALKAEFLERVAAAGYATNELIFVDQSKQ